MFQSIYIQILIGPTIPVPAPYEITNAITSIDFQNSDNTRGGFQISLKIGRHGNNNRFFVGNDHSNFQDFNLLDHPSLKPFSRVICIVTINFIPKVLFDGVITNIQTIVSDIPGSSTLVITGEDLSILMDLKENPNTYENQSDMQIATNIINSYANYGIRAVVVPPSSTKSPTVNEYLPSKPGTDLAYLEKLAAKHDYIFFIEPTDIPRENIGYWGPKDFAYTHKNPLNVNMGPDTNVSSINFQYDALKPVSISGIIINPYTTTQVPLNVNSSSRPTLANKSPRDLNQGNIREIKFRLNGMDIYDASNEAQSMVNKSTESVTASGDIDILRYGDILRARSIVFVRGAGLTNNGMYYVRSVNHSIKPGQFYRQSFQLTREGFETNRQKIN